MGYDSSYGVYESSAMSAGAIFANAIISLAFVVLTIIAYWRIFTKAGEEGWKAIIPFYNAYTAMKLFWKAAIFWICIGLGFGVSIGYGMAAYGIVALAIYGGGGNLAVTIIGFVLAFGCGIAAFVLHIMYLNRMSKTFGHGAGFTVGLLFLNFIFILILAFGKSERVISGQQPQQGYAQPQNNAQPQGYGYAQAQPQNNAQPQGYGYAQAQPRNNAQPQGYGYAQAQPQNNAQAQPQQGYAQRQQPQQRPQGNVQPQNYSYGQNTQSQPQQPAQDTAQNQQESTDANRFRNPMA